MTPDRLAMIVALVLGLTGGALFTDLARLNVGASAVVVGR